MQTQSSPIRHNRLANLLIEASPVAIVLTDQVGIIEVVNNVTEAWFGYRESELAGKSVETLFPHEVFCDDGSQATCILAQLRDPSVSHDWSLFGRRKDGSEFPVRVTLHPLVTVSGEMVLANVLDMSDFDARTKKRIAGERLAAVLEMVSGLAHESRNALQRAQSCLDLLELDLSNKADLLHLADCIRSALSDLHNNYEEVKDYAAPIVLKRTTVDLSQLCQTIFDELVAGCGQQTPNLNIRCDAACQGVSVDESRMKQVFRNLLENALQASLPHGDIEWFCQAVTSSQGNTVEMTLRDHGPGLSVEAARRKFEPFFTTKLQGTGLGLAVCRRIIEAHNGTIEAANHPDGGAVVRIALPH